MELQTISQVSKTYDISSRMLRYYEQVGLLQSIRNEENSYRYYDNAALKRVQQIIILRKLQIPVKQICVILSNPEAETMIDIFNKNISELDSEITALSTIKNILNHFVKELEKISDIHLNLDFLSNDTVLKSTGTLSLIHKNTKETHSINDLNKAADVLNKLKDVRIVYLPPMTVAAAHYTGESPNEKAWAAINDFIKQHNLFEIKPDLRVFKIDLSNATGQNFGHEMWVSIPDDFNVPAPLIKKKFRGGQYAAHLLGDDGFLTYLGMQDWINENEKYQYDYDGNLTRVKPSIEKIDSFGGTRLDPEEILNFHEVYHHPGSDIQYDVYFPIKRHQEINDIPVPIPGSEEKCGFKASIVIKSKFKIIGFTKVMTPDTNPQGFEEELIADGRLDLLNKYKKPGAPILGFGSLDMDSQMRGGWRWSICLQESDITDVDAFMKHNPYIRTLDASRWLIIEHKKEEPFDNHDICIFLFLGIENKIIDSIETTDFGKVWGNFFEAGGFGKIDPYKKHHMIVWLYTIITIPNAH